MVASFMDKAFSKSYVRLPGTGSDKKAEASFCDLSRGSSLAASIQVPQNVGTPIPVHQHLGASIPLPDQVSNSIPVPQHEGISRCVTSKLAPWTVSSTIHNKRPRSEDNTVDDNAPNKRLRMDNTDQNDTRTSSNHTFNHETVPAGPVNTLPTKISSNVASTTIRADNEPVIEDINLSKHLLVCNADDVTKLREENIQLRTENAALHKQLSLFKQLIRNPKRLESVVQRLNERALLNSAV